MKKVVTYTFGVVALYIVVANYTGAGKLLTAGAGAYATSVKALQGRK